VVEGLLAELVGVMPSMLALCMQPLCVWLCPGERTLCSWPSHTSQCLCI